MSLAEVENSAVRVQSRRNQALAAENVIGAEALLQSIEMAHAVEQRQDHRLRSDRWRERGHCVVEVVGLAAEKNESAPWAPDHETGLEGSA
jgi:DNA-binding sugar fermentation-stimulating protein